MVRTIITPSESYLKLEIPKEYVGKEIEVTFFALDELAKNKSSKSSMAGFGI